MDFIPQQETTKFIGEQYANQTLMHPISIIVLIALAAVTLILPRRYAILPFFLLSCIISSAQRIDIMGLDFTFIRLLVVVGFIRIMIRRENRNFTLVSLDKWIVCSVLVSALVQVARVGTASAFVGQLGNVFDAIGMYFLFRCFIQNWKDIECFIVGAIIVGIPISISFLREYYSGHNMFYIFGGVPEITVIRDGKMRCQGAFAHPIIAGCFWASLLPLFASQYWKKGIGYLWAALGVFCCLAIVVTSSSSTPIMSVFFAIVGAMMFYARFQLKRVRWGIFIVLFLLHMVMNKPVWHLLARVNIVGGSTGYHRYVLLDQAINRVGEWWLMGTNSTAHWGMGMEDVTNQYVWRCVEGGVWGLIFFLILIVVAFRNAGIIWRRTVSSRYYLAMAWAIGVSMFIHIMNYFAVSYFGQIIMVWYLHLAMIGSMTPSGPGLCTIDGKALTKQVYVGSR